MVNERELQKPEVHSLRTSKIGFPTCYLETLRELTCRPVGIGLLLLCLVACGWRFVLLLTG